MRQMVFSCPLYTAFVLCGIFTPTPSCQNTSIQYVQYVLAIRFSRKCFASSRRNSFKSLSPQSKELTVQSSVRGTIFILPANFDLVFRVSNAMFQCSAIDSSLLVTETFYLICSLNKSKSIFTKKNRCFLDWSCHSCNYFRLFSNNLLQRYYIFLRFENYCAKIMQYTLFYGSIIVNYLPLVFSVLLCLDSFLIGEIAFPKLFFL